MRTRTLVFRVCLAGTFAPGSGFAQSANERPALKFDVASIKLNTSGCDGGRGGGGAPPPGRLSVKCIAIQDLIQAAYGTFASASTPNQTLLRVVGAPPWVESDHYDLEATFEGKASVPQIYGPMLRSLLEERFRLKVRREVREAPVYALTVARSGHKLTATKDGGCTVFDPDHPPPQPARGQQPPRFCGSTSFNRRGGVRIIDSFGATMAQFAGTTLSSRVDLGRPAIDRTGLTGRYDVHLEFEDEGLSIFTAVQEQLGLRLSAEKGPVEVLVVERIERPTGN
jgi:uncharacterized protein (TIGR03435 family)